MSRIGKQPVVIPKGVQVTVTSEKVAVKGPKGQLEVVRHPAIEVAVEGEQVVFTRSSDDGKTRSAHGLMRALCNNMVQGVSEGFKRQLEINGVGCRADVKGSVLELQLGYSHPINYELPKGISAKVEKNIIVLEGVDKQLLGATAAKVRSFRPPEPYKGKGVKYVEERILRKVGKAAG